MSEKGGRVRNAAQWLMGGWRWAVLASGLAIGLLIGAVAAWVGTGKGRIAWGTGTELLAGVLTAGALVFAIHAFNDERRARVQEREDREREQAAHVFVDRAYTNFRELDNLATLSMEVYNRSSRPVTGLGYYVRISGKNVYSTSRLEDIVAPASEHGRPYERTLILRDIHDVQGGWPEWDAWIVFRDDSGLWWERHYASWLLVRLHVPPPEVIGGPMKSWS
jgi:hypothetical protein